MRIGDDDGHEVRLGHIELAQLEEGSAGLRIIFAQKSLQIL